MMTDTFLSYLKKKSFLSNELRLTVPYSCNFAILMIVWFLSLAWILTDKVCTRNSPGRDTLIIHTHLSVQPEPIVNGKHTTSNPWHSAASKSNDHKGLLVMKFHWRHVLAGPKQLLHLALKAAMVMVRTMVGDGTFLIGMECLQTK